MVSESAAITSSGVSDHSQLKQLQENDYSSNEGRNYHRSEEVAYVLPNDDDETGRLNQQHWILKYVLQCDYHAPITKSLEEGITVLDSGCGPGTWTVEMAKSFPKSKFYGVDVAGAFPDSLPDNVELVTGNITKTIPYPDNTFDYIHQRLLFAGLTDDNWKSTLQELYRVLKPGGYVEIRESDFFNFINMGPLWTKLQSGTMGMFSAAGIPTKICEELEARIVNAGFVNPTKIVTPLPLNHDGKRGELVWNDLKHAYMNAQPGIAKIFFEWEDIKVYEAYIDSCGLEAKENRICVNWYAFYAQK